MFSKLTRFLITFCALFLLALFLLITVSLIPTSALRQNIQKTVVIFQEEGMYPSFGLPFRKIVLDNYTDALMFNTAYSINNADAFKSSLVNLRYYDESLGTDQIKQLESSLNPKDTKQTGYERYWHGYLLFLRPVLTIFSYEGIRIINAIILYGGLVWFVKLAWKILGKKYTLAILIGLITIDFFFIWKSLQFSSVFKLTLLSSIILLSNYKKIKTPELLFFIVGGFTSFVDLLTAPLITLGMLLIISTKLYKVTWKDIIIYSVIWSVGYISLWAGKWAIVQLLFVPNAFQISIDQIINRTVTQPDPNFSYVNTIKLNIFQLIGYDKSNKIVALMLAIIFAVFVWRYSTFTKETFKKIIPLAVIGIMPYVWYIVAANHSYLHVWYTYRIQFISVVATILIIFHFVDWKKIKKYST